MGFGAGTAFGNMGVSVHRAEMPIKKYKNISNCPDQGSLSVAFTNASVFGSQSAASVAVCACAWEKKRKNKEDRNNQTPPSLLWTEMPRRPRLLLKGFGQLCKGLHCRREHWEAAQKHQARTDSAIPTPAPQSLPAQPPGAPGQEGPSPGSTSLP